MYKHIILIIFSVLFLFGCSKSSENRSIQIEDYVLGSPYEIVLVDGSPPYRAESRFFVPIVPTVLVSEGTHILTVRLSNLYIIMHGETLPQDRSPVQLRINVSPNRTYRIVDLNGNPKLIKIGKR